MAATGATLTTAMRSNMLTLQSLQQKIGASQTRLGSGNKIAASVDNPPVYFAAKGLDERANDMMALKDAMGQAISTVKAADEGVQHIGELVEHAKGLTVAALQNLGDDPASQQSRRKLAEQYDGLLAQIDEMAEDSGYGGKNLINSKPIEFLATPESKAKAASAPGINAIDITNASVAATYTVRTHGDGAIAATEQGTKDVQDVLGLNHFRMFGYNSLTNGTFAPTKIELRRNGSDKATLTVFEGNEHTSIDVDLSLASSSGALRNSYKNLSQTGTWIAFDYDAVALAKLAKDQPLTTVAVEKSINLGMDISDSSGHVKTLSLTDTTSSRIRDGWNDVVVGGSTVRINIDEKTLQASSNYQSSSVLDGPLSASFKSIAFDNLNYDGAANLFYEESIDPNTNIANGNIFTTPLYSSYPTSSIFNHPLDISNSSPDITASFNVFGIPKQTSITATYDTTSMIGKVSSGIRVGAIGSTGNPYIYETGGSPHVPLGWSGWNKSTLLSVDVGSTDSGGSGLQLISITDDVGGKGSATITNNYDFSSEPSGIPVVMKGGSNDQAVLRIIANVPEKAKILIQVDSDGIFPTGVGATIPYLNTSDYNKISGVKAPTYLSVTDNGNDSAGAGQRRIDVAVAPDTITSPTVHSFNISNDALDHVDFNVPSGFAQGTKFQMSFDPSSGGSSQAQFVLFPPTASSGLVEPTTYVYRAANRGEMPVIDVRQNVRSTAGDSLVVQLGRTPGDKFTIYARNLTTNGTGLAVDRSINGWQSREDIEKAAVELEGATQKLRSASTELSGGLNIITTRETFTKEFSDVLSEGASKLTLLDQHEEGANLLMLQTQQQLSVTALSLAAKSQQSILNLF